MEPSIFKYLGKLTAIYIASGFVCCFHIWLHQIGALDSFIKF
jgi:hypothetical protein